MKKVVVAILVLIMTMALVACKEKKTEMDIIRESVSYEETDVKVAVSDDARIELITVSGESALSLDGAIGTKSKRSIIKLYPTHLDSTLDSFKVKLSSGDNALEVTLLKDILGMSFSANMQEGVLTFVPQKVSVMVGEKSQEMELVDVLADTKVDKDKALNIAYETMKESVQTYFDDGKYNGEVVIKLIHNKRVPESPYYFYVSFIKNKDNFASCLIDPMTGDVVNKKSK